LNLVSNAAKFTEKGFITINATVEEDAILFSVADTGVGIPEGAKNILFGRYRQASIDIARTVGGTGLGLNICQQLTTMHGGNIWFESQVGQGSTFYFTIPLAPASSNGEPLVIDTRARITDTSTAQIFEDSLETEVPIRQVLLIDSSSESRSALENALTEGHYNVLSTDNHERALNIATMLVPDVVLIHLHEDDTDQMKNLAWLLHKDDSLAGTEILVLDARRNELRNDKGHVVLCQLALQMIQAKLPA
jgi:CheY-like chemotaxis protein